MRFTSIRNGHLVFVNSACVRLFGAESAEQLQGRPLLDFIHPDQREIVRGRMRVLYQEQRYLPGMEAAVVAPGRLRGGRGNQSRAFYF